jgi:hypothetical protein
MVNLAISSVVIIIKVDADIYNFGFYSFPQIYKAFKSFFISFSFQNPYFAIDLQNQLLQNLFQNLLMAIATDFATA